MGIEPTRATFLRAAGAEVSWRDEERSLQELIFSCVRRVLDEAGLRFEDVDGVVLAAHDMVDGRSLSSMVSAPAAGAYLRDEVRLGEDGAAALALASSRVRAGHSRNCIVAAWGRAGEGDQDRVANALFDPFFAKPLGLTEVGVSAMRASGALRAYSGYAEHRAAAAERRSRLAASRWSAPGGRRAAPALPLQTEELPIWSDVVAATVVTSEPTDLRIGGTGSSSEPYWLGDRELLSSPALRQAAGRALRRADRRLEEIDVAEIDGLTLFDEALAVEAIGLAPDGGGMEALASDGRLNRSGGGASGYCAPAMGLVRVVEASRALRSSADGADEVAIATGASTVAAQTQTAVVLEAVRGQS